MPPGVKLIGEELLGAILRSLGRRGKNGPSAGIMDLIRTGKTTAPAILQSVKWLRTPDAGRMKLALLRIMAGGDSAISSKLKPAQVSSFIKDIGPKHSRQAESIVKKFETRFNKRNPTPAPVSNREAKRASQSDASRTASAVSRAVRARPAGGIAARGRTFGAKAGGARSAGGIAARGRTPEVKSGGLGKRHLVGTAAGGFLLSRLIGGGGGGGDPMKAAARQQILAALMGDDSKADRQPLIDAQAELAKVKTMQILQRIMSQQAAVATAIPFS